VLNLPLNGLRSGEPIKGVIVRASESAGFKKVLSTAVILMILVSSLCVYKVNASVPQVGGRTWDDPAHHLSYSLREFQDASFTIDEYYQGGLSRHIVGHVYLDNDLKPKAAVDSVTSQYWENTQNVHGDEILDFLTVAQIIKWALEGVSWVKVATTWMVEIALNHIVNQINPAPDAIRVENQMMLAAWAAFDLYHANGVILPTRVDPVIAINFNRDQLEQLFETSEMV